MSKFIAIITLGLALLGLLRAEARAALSTPIPFAVDAEGCPELAASLSEQIAVELGPTFALVQANPAASATVRCDAQDGGASVAVTLHESTERFAVDAPLSTRTVAMTIAARIQRAVARQLSEPPPPLPPAAREPAPKVVFIGPPVTRTDAAEARTANRIMIPGIVLFVAGGVVLSVAGGIGAWGLSLNNNEQLATTMGSVMSIPGAILAAAGLPLTIVGAVKRNRANKLVYVPRVDASLSSLRLTF